MKSSKRCVKLLLLKDIGFLMSHIITPIILSYLGAFVTLSDLSSALSFLTQEKETFLSHDTVRWSETLSIVEVNSLPF